MGHEQKLRLKIVANLSDSFSRIFSSTSKKMNDLAKTSKNLNAKMASVNGLKDLQKKAMESGLAFQKHQRALIEFKKTLGPASEMSKQQAKDLARLTDTVKMSSSAFDLHSKKLKNLRTELKAAGIDTKNINTALTSLRREFEKSNQKMGSQKRLFEVQRAASDIQHKGRNARYEAFGSIVGAGGTAAAAMYDPLQYTHEMNKVHILGKESDGEKYNPKVLESITQNIAKSYGMGLVETAKVASSYLLGGMTPRETEAMMAPTFDLAVASDTNVEDVGGLMKALKASFHLDADPDKPDMKYLSNAVAKASNASDLSVADLAESSKYLLDLPHNFGMKLHEMLGILSVSGDAQFKGSEAGTASVQMLERLAQPKIQDKLKEKLNVRVTKKGPKGTIQFRNIFDVVKDIAKSLKGKGNAQKEAVIVEIFETQAGRAMRNVLGNIPKLEANARSFSKQNIDSQYAENLRVQMQNSPLAKLKASWSSMAVLNTKLFDTYGDKIAGLADKLIDVTNSTSAFVEKNKDAISTLVKASGAVLGLGLSWKVVKALSLTALVPLFDMGKAFMWILTKANPIVAVVTAIASASYLLWQNWESIVKTMNAAWVVLGSAKDTFFPSQENILEIEKIPKVEPKQSVMNDNKQLSVTMNIQSGEPKAVANEVREKLKASWSKEIMGQKPLFDMATL
jgi:TP901 family phage tail tape measure protein